MKVKILKTARWAKHPAWGPIVDIVEGQIYIDNNEDFCKRLIDTGYAEATEEVEVEEEEIEEDDPEVSSLFTDVSDIEDDVDGFDNPPWEHDGWSNDLEDAKDILEEYCLLFYGIDIDKRKSVEDLIDYIKTLDK